MNADIFSHSGEGIRCVYNNNNWVVCIKNWKPNNDIENIQYLEVHHATDEQFVLISGKAVLITAERDNGKFVNIELTPMEIGKVYNVPKEMWFYSITRKDTKMAYVQDSNCSMDNSELCDMTKEEIEDIQKRAEGMLRG